MGLLSKFMMIPSFPLNRFFSIFIYVKSISSLVYNLSFIVMQEPTPLLFSKILSDISKIPADGTAVIVP